MHSSYWRHCSLRAKSKLGSSCFSWPRSFFSPTARSFAMRDPRDRPVIGELLPRSHPKAGDLPPLRVGVDHVVLDGVEAGLRAQLRPRLHPLQDELAVPLGPEVEPVLVREAVAERLADQPPADLAIELDVLPVVGPELLRGAGVDVAEGMTADGVDRVHRPRVQHALIARDRRVLVEVEVPHRRAHAAAAAERRLADVDVDPAARPKRLLGPLQLVLQPVVGRGGPGDGAGLALR